MRDEDGNIDEVWARYIPVTRDELDMLANDPSGIHWKNIMCVVGIGEFSLNATPEHLIRMIQDVKYGIAMLQEDGGVPQWIHYSVMKGNLPEDEGLASLVSTYRALANES